MTFDRSLITMQVLPKRESRPVNKYKNIQLCLNVSLYVAAHTFERTGPNGDWLKKLLKDARHWKMTFVPKCRNFIGLRDEAEVKQAQF